MTAIFLMCAIFPRKFNCHWAVAAIEIPMLSYAHARAFGVAQSFIRGGQASTTTCRHGNIQICQAAVVLLAVLANLRGDSPFDPSFSTGNLLRAVRSRWQRFVISEVADFVVEASSLLGQEQP